MAVPTTLRFGQAVIQVGGGETPTEIFTAPCGFESISWVINTETSNNNLPDCAAPDDPTWTINDIISKQAVVSGEGFFDATSWKNIWQLWALNGTTKNVRFQINLTSANGGGYYQAPGILTTFEINAERGGRARVNIAITLQGKPTWTAATP